MKNVTAVILAAGLGTRMRSALPKVLHKVGGDTILGKIISNLREAGIDDIIAVVGHKAEIVEDLFADEIRFVRQDELLGSGHALAQAMEQLEEKGDVLVTCGDTPLISAGTYQELLRGHQDEEASCTLLTCEVSDPESYGRIIRDIDGKIQRIVEEKDLSEEQRQVSEINVGSYCFRNSDIKKFVHDIEMNEKKKEFYLTDIVDILEDAGRKIISRSCTSGESLGINSRKDLAKANKMLNKNKVDELMDAGVTVIDPETTYVDESVTVGADTVIYPGTVIEADVKVGEACKIGPFARLRPGTRLGEKVEVGNFVELNRSSLGEGTTVKHQVCLCDLTAGKDVNIGAGTVIANYDGTEKHRTTIEDGAFIGVGAVLIAPVVIGKGAVVGAGSVVTKNKNVKAGDTVTGIPAKPMASKKAKDRA